MSNGLPPEIELFIRDNMTEITGYTFIDDIKYNSGQNGFISGWQRRGIYIAQQLLQAAKDGKISKDTAKEIFEKYIVPNNVKPLNTKRT